MSHYTIEELIARWKKEELTAEQMIGQMLQVMKQQEERMREIAQRLPGAAAATGEVGHRNR